MRKSEIFAHLLHIVEEETEVEADKILSHNKTAEVVDARYMLVYFLSYMGMYPQSIARSTGISQQGVRQILYNFDRRRKQNGNIFEITYQRILNKIEMI